MELGEAEGIIVGQKFAGLVTVSPSILDARIETTTGGPCRSLCKHIFAACVQFRLRCCRLAGVASEAQVCDMWAPVQILAIVWTFVPVTPRDSSKARPEGEGQLPQRAFISRSASNLPGLDWQSR